MQLSKFRNAYIGLVTATTKALPLRQSLTLQWCERVYNHSGITQLEFTKWAFSYNILALILKISFCSLFCIFGCESFWVGGTHLLRRLFDAMIYLQNENKLEAFTN